MAKQRIVFFNKGLTKILPLQYKTINFFVEWWKGYQRQSRK